MSSECVICTAKTGFFDKRCDSGYICSECFSHIPKMIDYRSCSTERLKRMIKLNRKRQRIFQQTANLGSLYLDNIHRMFLISQNSKQGEPTEFCDIYSMSDIQEIGLYCTNPQCISKSISVKVVCDVELFVKTPEYQFRTIILQNEKCSWKADGSHKIQWEESGRVSMFRSMWGQMIADESNRVLKEVDAVRNNRLIAWAEGVLMLNSDYTHEELVMHHDKLIKCLNGNISSDYMEKLERAYQILEYHLRLRERENADEAKT